jgi:hypothetical protein
MAGGSGHARAGGTCSGRAVPARWHCTFCRLGGLRSRRFASSRGATFGLCRAVEVRWPRLRERPDALATLDLALYEVANVVVAAWKDRHAARRLRGLIATVPDDGGCARSRLSRPGQVAHRCRWLPSLPPRLDGRGERLRSIRAMASASGRRRRHRSVT